MLPKAPLPVLHAAAIQHADLRVDTHKRSSHSALHRERSNTSMFSLHSRLASHDDTNVRGPVDAEAPASAGDVQTAPVPVPPLSAATVMERYEPGPLCNRLILILTLVCLGLSVASVALGIGALMMSHIRVIDSAQTSAAAVTYPTLPSPSDNGTTTHVTSCTALAAEGCGMPNLHEMATVIVEQSRQTFTGPLATILTAMEPFEVSGCSKGAEALPLVHLSLTSRPYPHYIIPSLVIRCPSLLYDQRFAFALTYSTISYMEHMATGTVTAETIGATSSLTFSMRMGASSRCHISALCFLVATMLLSVAVLLVLWLGQCRLRAVKAPVERRCFPDALPPPASFTAIVVDGDASADQANSRRPFSHTRRSLGGCGSVAASQNARCSRPRDRQADPNDNAAARAGHVKTPHERSSAKAPSSPTSPCLSRASSTHSAPAFVDEEAEMTAVMFPFGVSHYAANPSNACFEMPTVLTAVASTARFSIAGERSLSDAAVGATATADDVVEALRPDPSAAAAAAPHDTAVVSSPPAEEAISPSRLSLGEDTFYATHPLTSREPLTTPNSPIKARPIPRATSCSCSDNDGDGDVEEKEEEETEVNGLAVPKDSKACSSHHATPAAAGTEGTAVAVATAANTAESSSTTSASLNPLHRGLAVEGRDDVTRRRERRVRRVRIAFLAVRQTLMSISTLSAVTGLVLMLVAMILRVNGSTVYNTEQDQSADGAIGVQGVVAEYKAAAGLFYILSIVTVGLVMATTVVIILTMVKSSRIY